MCVLNNQQHEWFSFTWTGGPYGNSTFSLLWVATVGLLELMSTGELISSVCRSVGEWTILLSEFKALVIENGLRLFLLDSDTLRKVGDSVPFALGEAVLKGDEYLNEGDRWLFFVCRSCLAVMFGWDRKKRSFMAPSQKLSFA